MYALTLHVCSRNIQKPTESRECSSILTRTVNYYTGKEPHLREPPTIEPQIETYIQFSNTYMLDATMQQ